MKAKKIFSISFMFVLIAILLVGCNNSSNIQISDVSGDNYEKVTKKFYGIKLLNSEGWTLKETKNPDNTENLNIEWEISEAEDFEKIIEEYFKQCKKVSKNGVYSQDFNSDFTALEKKEKYTDFETFFEAEGIKIATLRQAMWIYDYNGENILFTISIDETVAEMTFTKM